MPVLVPLLRAEGEIDIDDGQAALLAGVSAATIDRMLAGERRRMTLRGRTHTKPGSLLKHQIPIRTFTDWDDAISEFVEIDLVAHDGGVAAGEYCYTLTMTDIATGWTLNRSVPNKARRWVIEAIDHAADVFPFRSWGSSRQQVGVHQPSPAALLRAASDHVHPRPGREEERRLLRRAENWARVRGLIGYYRYDTATELEVLNDIWALDDAFANYFLPSLKLKSKHRDGAKVVKTYHQAATPHQRALAHPATRKRPVITMNARFKRLKPGHCNAISSTSPPAWKPSRTRRAAPTTTLPPYRLSGENR